MQQETITPDLTKHYLTEEPFFIVDKATKEVFILRPANHDPIKEAN
jgi:hypothetical protein